MKIEVLLSTMHQKDFSILKKCNIRTDAVVINQCDEENLIEEETEYGHVSMINTRERGLSNSRNMALKNADGDICILCDEDVTYVDDYAKIVEAAFTEIPDADVIVFNIERVAANGRSEEKRFQKVERIPFYKSYGSVHIAFKRERILEAGIRFNPKFGAGSNQYLMAEDALFFRNIHKCGLKAYVYPAVFARVTFDGSSWFTGYHERYFYDVGAFLSAAYPRTKHLMKWYYPLRFRNLSELPAGKIMKNIRLGFKGYKKDRNYEQFMRKIFFLGDFLSDNGPGNANKQIFKSLENKCNGRISGKKGKISRIFEVILGVRKSDVLLICSRSQVNYLAIKLAKKQGKKILYVMHGLSSYEAKINDPDITEESLKSIENYEEFIFSSVDKVIAVSKFFMEYLQKEFPNYADKFDYIYNVIDENLFSGEMMRPEDRKRQVVSAGGGTPQKKNLQVAEALQELNDSGMQLEYIVVGRGMKDGEQIKKQPCVTWRENMSRKELLALMGESEIYIQNSSFETFGLAIVEALFSGCSILISNQVGCRDLFETITDDDVIYDTNDKNEIQEKVKKLLLCGNNERLRNGFQKEVVSPRWQSDKMIRIIEQLQ